jgi:hypothetical protein
MQEWLAAHIRLARLYLARGEKSRAKEVLDKSLLLWKDADRDLSLLNNARRLRAEL